MTKFIDLDFFSSRPIQDLHRIDKNTTLLSGVFDLTSGYKESMLIIVNYMNIDVIFGGKVLLALDILQIYDENIYEKFKECNSDIYQFVEYLNQNLSEM